MADWVGCRREVRGRTYFSEGLLRVLAYLIVV